MKKKDLIVVRGAGDLATGTIHRLKKAGFRLLVLEAEHPAAIRRQVALSEAVYAGSARVEDVEAVRMDVDLAEKKNRKELLEQEMERIWKKAGVPVLVDPAGLSIAALRPAVVVDAILAKKNLGTTKEMAPLVIALGPGFMAGEDVDVVIETKRGHNLGRVIRSGSAVPNTGNPDFFFRQYMGKAEPHGSLLPCPECFVHQRRAVCPASDCNTIVLIQPVADISRITGADV